MKNRTTGWRVCCAVFCRCTCARLKLPAGRLGRAARTLIGEKSAGSFRHCLGRSALCRVRARRRPAPSFLRLIQRAAGRQLPHEIVRRGLQNVLGRIKLKNPVVSEDCRLAAETESLVNGVGHKNNRDATL